MLGTYCENLRPAIQWKLRFYGKEWPSLLVNLKEKLDDAYIRELISYSVFPDPDQLDQVINQYMIDDRSHIAGLEIEGKVVGIIGYQLSGTRTLHVQHIAVHPEERGQEYGRGLMIGVIDTQQPQMILAETDEDTVDFYRNIGFTVESVGEEYPGHERFRCTYEVGEG